MSAALTKYLVPCLTEGINVITDFRSSVPTVCPNNNTHTIDASGIMALDSTSLNIITINENNQIPNGGFYRADCFEIAVTGGTGTVTTYDISYPYNIGAYSTTLLLSSDNIGDTLNIIGYPDTAGSIITIELGTGATGLNVSLAAIFNPGFYVSITDGVNTDDLGEIITVDDVNNILTVSTPTVNSFGTGSVVLFGIPRVKNCKFCNTNNIDLGFSKIGSSGLLANHAVRLLYTNSSGTAKTFNFIVELQF